MVMRQSEAWIKQGQSVVAQLIKGLRDPKARSRNEMVWALGKIGDSRAFDVLVEMLADPDESIRHDTVAALGFLGDKRAVAVLLPLLKDADSSVQANAIRSLGELDGSNHLNDFVEALNSDNLEISLIALYVLKKIDDPRVNSILLNNLTHPDKIMRADIALALGKLKDELVIAPLIDLLEHDSEAWVRANTASALGNFDTPQVLDALEKALHTNPDDLYKSYIVEAIGQIKNPRSAEILMNGFNASLHLSARDFARAFASLGEIGISALINCLGDPDFAKEYWATQVLEYVGVQALPQLTKLMTHPNQRMRHAVIYIVGSWKHASVIPFLEQVADDPDPEIRENAQKTLLYVKKQLNLP